MLFTDYCTFVGHWHILLQKNDSMLAHGGVFQYCRCVSLQCFCGLEGDQSRMEGGWKLQEETVPWRAWQMHGGAPLSRAQTTSTNTFLCCIGKRHESKSSHIHTNQRRRRKKNANRVHQEIKKTKTSFVCNRCGVCICKEHANETTKLRNIVMTLWRCLFRTIWENWKGVHTMYGSSTAFPYKHLTGCQKSNVGKYSSEVVCEYYNRLQSIC